MAINLPFWWSSDEVNAMVLPILSMVEEATNLPGAPEAIKFTLTFKVNKHNLVPISIVQIT